MQKRLFWVVGILVVTLLLDFVVFRSVTKAEEISGSIYAEFNDHWGAEGNVKPPIIIKGPVVVEPDTTLIIDPGTIIIMQDDIVVKGALIAKGVQDNWIIFWPLGRLGGKIKIYRDATINHCYFDAGTYIRIIESSPIISHNIIIGEEEAREQGIIRIYGESSSPKIIYNFFTGGTVSCLAIVIINDEVGSKAKFPTIEENVIKDNNCLAIFVGDSSWARINKNILKDNARDQSILIYPSTAIEVTNNLVTGGNTGIYVASLGPIIKNNAIYDNSQFNLEYSGEQKLVVENNYWGAERPDATKFKGNIDFVPWLKEPPAELPIEEQLGVPYWEGIIATWARMLKNEDKELRYYVAEKLYEKKDKRAVPVLIEKYKEILFQAKRKRDTLGRIRINKAAEQTVKTLIKISPNQSVPILMEALKNDEVYWSCYEGYPYYEYNILTKVLGDMRDLRSIPALVARASEINDSAPFAAEALGKIGDKKVVPDLKAALGRFILEHPGSGDAHMRYLEALTKLTGEDWLNFLNSYWSDQTYGIGHFLFGDVLDFMKALPPGRYGHHWATTRRYLDPNFQNYTKIRNWIFQHWKEFRDDTEFAFNYTLKRINLRTPIETELIFDIEISTDVNVEDKEYLEQLIQNGFEIMKKVTYMGETREEYKVKKILDTATLSFKRVDSNDWKITDIYEGKRPTVEKIEEELRQKPAEEKAASNVALGKPVSITTNGTEDSLSYAGNSPSDATDGSLEYRPASEGIDDGCVGWANEDYNETITITITIDLEGTYNITKIRYNPGNCERAETWNADIMESPFGRTTTNPGSPYRGTWTEQTGNITTSKVTIKLEKTRRSHATDWLFIGEIEVLGTLI